MAQVNAAQLPNELFDVKVPLQFSLCHRFLRYPDEQLAPALFEHRDVRANWSGSVIQLEQRGGDGAAAVKAGARAPAEPTIDEYPQPSQARGGLHCRYDDRSMRQIRRCVEQLNFELALRAHVGKQSTFGQSHGFGNPSERKAGQPVLAEQVESGFEQSCFGVRALHEFCVSSRVIQR